MNSYKVETSDSLITLFEKTPDGDKLVFWEKNRDMKDNCRKDVKYFIDNEECIIVESRHFLEDYGAYQTTYTLYSVSIISLLDKLKGGSPMVYNESHVFKKEYHSEWEVSKNEIHYTKTYKKTQKGDIIQICEEGSVDINF